MCVVAFVIIFLCTFDWESSEYYCFSVSKALVPEREVQSLGILCWIHTCDNDLILKYVLRTSEERECMCA